jgi:hypothetical protein
MPRLCALLLAGWLILPMPPAGAQTTTTSSTSTTIIVGGGGGARTECMLVLGTAPNTPASNPRHFRCADGDPCDGDRTVNGECKLPVSACGNSTFDSRCTSPGVGSIVVDHAIDNGEPKFDPEFQALQNVIDSGIDIDADTPDDCTAVIDFHVRVQGPFAGNACRPGRKLLRITTESDFSGGTVKDRDRLRMICDPSPSGCDPMAFYTSAFDRIQRQIFDQSCAVSGCHDSQSYEESGQLLLENAYNNLINVTPDNDAAQGAGWLRVNQTSPTTGDPQTSFLFRKVDHDLPSPDYGLGMPRLRPKLDQSLIDVIEAWIIAGAPATGWPPGTF